QDVSELLAGMGQIARQSGSAPHLASFRKLLDERRDEVAQIVGVRPGGNYAEALRDNKASLQLSAAQMGDFTLERMRKQYPGLDRVLSGSSRDQLLRDLARQGPQGMARLQQMGMASGGGFGGQWNQSYGMQRGWNGQPGF